MERIMYKTPAFDSFYNSLNIRAKKKVDYVFEHIRTEKNVSSKFVKSLVNTDFYEMRISVDNEYRIILFAIDNDNFINANEIVLLNGFIKKSTSDYDKQIAIAQKIMEDIYE
jgi:phage-related protein